MDSSPRLEVDETRHGDIFDVEMFGFVKLATERLIHEYNRQYGLSMSSSDMVPSMDQITVAPASSMNSLRQDFKESH